MGTGPSASLANACAVGIGASAEAEVISTAVSTAANFCGTLEPHYNVAKKAVFGMLLLLSHDADVYKMISGLADRAAQYVVRQEFQSGVSYLASFFRPSQNEVSKLDSYSVKLESQFVPEGDKR